MDTGVLERTAATLEIRADVADIRPASAWLEHQADAHSIPPDQLFRLDLCLNEALANVIEHGGQSAATVPIELSLCSQELPGGGAATLTVADGGPAFNPLASTPKEQAKSLAEASPGGLGIGLMARFADEIAYEYHQGRNHVRFVVRWQTRP